MLPVCCPCAGMFPAPSPPPPGPKLHGPLPCCSGCCMGAFCKQTAARSTVPSPAASNLSFSNFLPTIKQIKQETASKKKPPRHPQHGLHTLVKLLSRRSAVPVYGSTGDSADTLALQLGCFGRLQHHLPSGRLRLKPPRAETHGEVREAGVRPAGGPFKHYFFSIGSHTSGHFSCPAWLPPVAGGDSAFCLP